MSKVIDFKTRQKVSENREEKKESSLTWEEIAKKNLENQERIRKERLKDNEKVKRSYRIKQ